ncbi:uncharacterized protein PHALS_06548 [Plasmopara halstedii]|uniref:Uncharacterized protein n=1 Tax=Plasmopara halstedii TaxID=4781 RepID=A0A0P1B518_PLAHL|nr:uncharacterized protein PHALS_06548 [Plasmopara halstedii]CEG48742.1 hypothetical protein PHALS_06548 [Plasmopara halstedii]|eukprot:XP_024585111.1 hypothetical protein PHALS_06548 [Plasmopara halstedii]
MALGFLEDFVCATYFSTLLCVLDIVKHAVYKDRKFGIFGRFGTFVLSGLLLLVMMCPFIADLLLVVHRDMRFSSGLAATIIREQVEASTFSLDHRGFECMRRQIRKQTLLVDAFDVQNYFVSFLADEVVHDDHALRPSTVFDVVG